MTIINNGTYFTNKQIKKVIGMLGKDYTPTKIIICETKSNVFNLFKHISLLDYLNILFDLTVWFGKVEGIYFEHTHTIIVYVFSQTDDGDDIQSKQLYSLHALMHELRHKWQSANNFNIKTEEDADKFATNFINKNSKNIAKIMGWKEEWEVEEEGLVNNYVIILIEKK